MILRRFMKHVSDQNWFAVGLDVLVVITGIFLGMQVTEWNEDRQKSKEEAAILERLVEDIETSLSRLGKDKTKLEELLAQQKTAALLVLNGELTDQNIAHFGELRSTFDNMVPVHFKSGTVDELFSTGKLGLVKSTVKRRAIATLRDMASYTERQNQIYTNEVPGAIKAIQSLVPTGIGDQESHLLISAESVSANRLEIFGHMKIIISLNRTQLSFVSTYESLLQRVRTQLEGQGEEQKQ